MMTEQEYQRRLPEFRGTVTALFNKRLGHDPNDEQMNAYLAWIRNDSTVTAEKIDAHLAEEPEAIAYQQQLDNAAAGEAARKTAGPIWIDGPRFLMNGQRWIWKGFSDFLLLVKFLNGEDIVPILKSRAALGANLVRVLGMINSYARLHPQNVPKYYTYLANFFDV